MSLTDKCRPIMLGEYMVSKRATVRAAAKQFDISKSTVHKDIRERLPDLEPELNKQERHIRGGMATKHKYELQNMLREKNREDDKNL